MEITPPDVTPSARDMSRVTPTVPTCPITGQHLRPTLSAYFGEGVRARYRVRTNKKRDAILELAAAVAGGNARTDRGSKKLAITGDVRQVCMSLPVEDLAVIDRAARAARLSRSAFVRVAATKIAREIVDNDKRLTVDLVATLGGAA